MFGEHGTAWAPLRLLGPFAITLPFACSAGLARDRLRVSKARYG
jgi:hypothetical protein